MEIVRGVAVVYIYTSAQATDTKARSESKKKEYETFMTEDTNIIYFSQSTWTVLQADASFLQSQNRGHDFNLKRQSEYEFDVVLRAIESPQMKYRSCTKHGKSGKNRSEV